MIKKALLVLADGTVFQGYSFGARTDTYGEVVFNTSMTGYQEILTDPSYAGQIVVPTFPLIGNYGINDEDTESKRIQVRGFVVREDCTEPSHFLSKGTIHKYLNDSCIPGICGIDTRAVTRKLRSSGVMMGMITSDKTPDEALNALKQSPDYGSTDFVLDVSTDKPYEWPVMADAPPQFKVVVLDCGLKYNILRLLTRSGCQVTVMPCTTPAEIILKLDPDGILLSPGPGDPELLDYVVANVSKLIDKKPIMGICLGCQVLARAFGGKTFKLKFGHRGGNHPVKESATGRVHITAQNHGYAVDADSLKDGLEVSHINLNDGTVEGLRHKELPIFAIQYHSEAAPGPLDNTYLFDYFTRLMKSRAPGVKEGEKFPLNKQDIVSQLKRHLCQVPELRKLNYANGDFPRWKNDVLKTLTSIYGSDSSQYKRFEDAPGKFFKVDTELGRQQSYIFVLEMHESALNTLIQRAETG